MRKSPSLSHSPATTHTSTKEKRFQRRNWIEKSVICCWYY